MGFATRGTWTGTWAAAAIGAGLVLGGCSKAADKDDDDDMMQPVMGAAGSTAPMTGSPNQPTGGGGSTPVNPGNTNQPMAGNTTPSAGSGGSGVDPANPMAGSSGAMAGAAGSEPMTTAGSGGSTAPSGPDTSGFMVDCEQGGKNWGKPTQAGPCKSGISIYGVKTEFGPYGASSEYNVGKGFENTVNLLDNAATCAGFIDGFGADPIGSADLKDIHDLDLALYSVFYPGVMPEGEKFPLITWGNGTCAMPEGYGPLLRYVASHGYIVVAANSRYVSGGVPMTKAIDFMFAENKKMGGKYFGKIDEDKVGAMGHSQGSGATASASSDPRIKAVILFNGGAQANKPYLAISGERDIGDTGSPTVLSNPVMAAQRPAAYIYYHQVPMTIAMQPTGGLAGHLTLMMEPERVIEPTVGWWDMMLKNEPEAKAMFIGDTCKLCDKGAYPSKWAMPANPPSITYGHNAMLQ